MNDPFRELVQHEIGKLRTIHSLHMSAIVEPPGNVGQKAKNAGLRAYQSRMELVGDKLILLEQNYSGKQFRKEVQEWAGLMHKAGMMVDYSQYGTGHGYHEERKALRDASKAIIDAFKKLR